MRNQHRRQRDRRNQAGETTRALARKAVEGLLTSLQNARRALSPGLHYQLYAPVWTRPKEEWKTAKDKLNGIRETAECPRDLQDLLEALQRRQRRAWRALSARTWGVELKLRSVVPFTTGLGQAHPTEVGFAFLKPYGIPYLAASGIKGALRAALREEVWGQPGHERELLLFGNSPDRANGAGLRGSLVIFDLLPERFSLRADVLNPHFPKYYREKATPSEWQDPNPVGFLTVAPEATWNFRFVLDQDRKETLSSALRADIIAGLARLLSTRGLGAKTNSGYGLFEVTDSEGLTPEEQQTILSAFAWWKESGPEGAARGERSSPAAPDPRAHIRLEDHALVKQAARVNAGNLEHLYGRIEKEPNDELKTLALKTLAETVSKSKSLKKRVKQNRDRFPLLAPYMENSP